LNRRDTYESRQATGLRGFEAHQQNDVALIVVKYQFGGCLVCPHVGLADIETKIPHMTEQMAVRVLRQGSAEILTKSPEDDLGLRFSIVCDGKTTHEKKATSVLDFIEHRAQLFREVEQGEVIAVE